jgi:putative endonuclease
MLISVGLSGAVVGGDGGAMTKARQAMGAYGEQVAAGHLSTAGMALVDRNWRCRHGEIDIVARDGDVVVFCEVKTRSGTRFGAPVEAVVAAKARRLRRVAAQWLADRGTERSEVRFDVVTVIQRRGDDPLVEHIRGAF